MRKHAHALPKRPLNVLTCRRLADKFQEARKLERKADAAYDRAKAAELAFKLRKVQLDGVYDAKKADLELDLNSQKSDLTTEKAQLVSHLSAVLT